MTQHKIAKKGFDREFKNLIEQSLEIITEKYGVTINPERTYINKYSSIYNKMKPKEHFIYFERLYDKNEDVILGTLSSDKWIKNGNISIIFGKGILEKVKKEIQIPLSKIYNMAIELKVKAEEEMEEDDPDVNEANILKPNIILLHLMRIFYYIKIYKEDKADGRLIDIIKFLENELGCPTEIIPEAKAMVKTEGGTDAGSGVSSGLSTLFNVAKNLMRNMGVTPPDNIPAPTESDMENAINKVFTNENTQNTISSVLSSLQNTDDINGIIRSLMDTFKDPKTIESLTESVSGITDVPKTNP